MSLGFTVACPLCGHVVRAMTSVVLMQRQAEHYERCLEKKREREAAAKATQPELLFDTSRRLL